MLLNLDLDDKQKAEGWIIEKSNWLYTILELKFLSRYLFKKKKNENWSFFRFLKNIFVHDLALSEK